MHPTHQLLSATAAGKHPKQYKCHCCWQAFQAMLMPLLQEKCAAAVLDYEAVCAGQTVFQEIVNPNPKQPVKKEIKPDPGGPQQEVRMECSQPLSSHSPQLHTAQPVVQGLHTLLHLSAFALICSNQCSPIDVACVTTPVTTQQGACNSQLPVRD